MNFSLLERLKSPKDLKKFNEGELQVLVDEIRSRISQVVRETGGHLGPNLGSVELITAAHLSFDFSIDRLIFDVGHQSYPHKLLTGRHKDFDRLRQKNGISGYPHKLESIYDVFRSGHASTAISTATGLSEGFKIQNRPHYTVAIVGDGSMTGGMAFEGLNHAGHLKSRLIVVLNDNTMSISPTIGALSRTLNKLRHHKIVGNFKEDILSLIAKLPKIGDRLEEFVNVVVDETRNAINPSQIFTNLGFDYIGPVDGHNIQAITVAYESAKKQKVPVLVHLLTNKGKDYLPEGIKGLRKVGPHALSPGQKQKEESDKENHLQKKKIQKLEKKTIAWSEAFANYLIHLAKKDKKIVAITAAMAEGTKLDKFSQVYPNRYFDVGICEQHAVGFSAGLSESGVKPVFAVYSTFLQRAIDQIFHDILLQGHLKILFAIDRAGLVGDDGPSHHGLYDISYLSAFPGIVLMAPCDEKELQLMMDFYFTQNQTMAIRYPRGSIKNHACKTGQAVKLGTPVQLEKGTDVAIVFYGSMLHIAIETRDKLSKIGYSASIYNARFAKPLNEKNYKKIALTHKSIITMEEGTIVGGFGSMVNQLLVNEDCKLLNIAVPDRLIEHASPNQQFKDAKIDADSVIKQFNQLIK